MPFDTIPLSPCRITGPQPRTSDQVIYHDCLSPARGCSGLQLLLTEEEDVLVDALLEALWTLCPASGLVSAYNEARHSYRDVCIRILITLARIGILRQICWFSQEGLSPVQPNRPEPWHCGHHLWQVWPRCKGRQGTQWNARRQATNEGKQYTATILDFT